MNVKLYTLAISTAVVLLCSYMPPAFADGMPFKSQKPEPILIPMDKSLQEIQPPAQAPVPESLVPPPPETRTVEVQSNPSFFGLSVGMYDPFTHSKKATSFNAEYQSGVRIAGVLQPIFGAMITTQGSLLGYGGIGAPFKIGEHVRMLPSIAVGAYKRGGGFDFGQSVIFRAGTELAYEFDDQSRIGLNFHVLTNGDSTGRRDRTEVIGLAYTVPLKPFTASNEQQMPAPTMATPATQKTTADMITYQ